MFYLWKFMKKKSLCFKWEKFCFLKLTSFLKKTIFGKTCLFIFQNLLKIKASQTFAWTIFHFMKKKHRSHLKTSQQGIKTENFGTFIPRKTSKSPTKRDFFYLWKKERIGLLKCLLYCFEENSMRNFQKFCAKSFFQFWFYIFWKKIENKTE